ncbi:MAG: hypothetical protein PW792_04515 [Acidobacteriaceae bacterium]|nr:hypothetical protein [Acidobacteriaceae bacterium]
MDVTALLVQIDAEIARLQKARTALASLSSSTPVRRGPGRPPKANAGTPNVAKKRVMSEEARAKIAAAQKKRWAAQKKAK